MKNLVLFIDIVNKKSVPIELHYNQVTLKFIRGEESLDLLIFLLSETIVDVILLDQTLKLDSISAVINPPINLHQNHFQHLHLGDLIVIYNKIL